ncbi:hypothetical protein [Azorhizobium sp. AG788]|uniref:hypothetical protein n=1 Tax=Azorhizobium sp. AG788 TaxID=2183897 RepID=UPI003138CAE2
MTGALIAELGWGVPRSSEGGQAAVKAPARHFLSFCFRFLSLLAQVWFRTLAKSYQTAKNERTGPTGSVTSPTRNRVGDCLTKSQAEPGANPT